MLVAREIENKAFAKVCWKKKLYYGEIESRTDRFTAWAWSSWREWRSSWITVKLNAWVGYETFLGLANHNSFRVFSWHISSQFALVLAYYFTTLTIINWICVDLIKLQTECVATVVVARKWKWMTFWKPLGWIGRISPRNIIKVKSAIWTLKKEKKILKKKSSLICLCVIQSKICLKTNKACKYDICRFLLNGKKVSYDWRKW